jgi:hypothetical protein
MTSQGSAHGRFTRAIQQGNLWAAEIAARELRGLALDDALDLVALIARSRPDRLERAAIRWHGRLGSSLRRSRSRSLSSHSRPWPGFRPTRRRRGC